MPQAATRLTDEAYIMRYVFACGGTAGHINPALAIAGKLTEGDPDAAVLFIGAEGKMEMNLVPRQGYEIKGLHITNISRGHNAEAILHNLDTVKNVAVSLKDAKRILKEFKPDAVIGTGGYVCYPVLSAAADMHIPTAVHESNAEPGLTTKLLAGRVSRIFLGFEDGASHYGTSEQKKITVTGTPVRGSFDSYDKAEARKELGIDDGIPLVVSVWGSLGSGYMNNVISDMIPQLAESKAFRLIHSTGSAYYPKISEKLDASVPDRADRGIDVREYIYDMDRVMTAADLVMCRAGASTLTELCYLGKPSLIVPSPNVTNNHQEKNARLIEKAGGAEVLLEGEFDSSILYNELCRLTSDRTVLENMGACAAGLSKRDSLELICSSIHEMIESGRR